MSKILVIFLMGVVFPVFAAEHHPEEFLTAVGNLPNAGEKIYSHFCATCHAKKPIIPVGAPRVGVEKDWARYTENQTVEQMIKKIDAGVGAMPPRGGCFECSDKNLQAAIEYMLPKTPKTQH